MEDNRITYDDNSELLALLSSIIGPGVYAGSSFLFADIAGAPVSGIAAMFGAASPKPQIVSLWGEGQFKFPGVTIKRTTPLWPLGAVFAARDIYQPDNTADVFVFLPGRVGDVPVRVTVNGQQDQTLMVQLDVNSVGHLRISNVRMGEYEIAVDGIRLPGRFSVSEYRLAALSADLLSAVTDADTIAAELRVFAFGEPLANALVMLELHEDGRRAARAKPCMTDGTGTIAGTWDLSGLTGNLSVIVWQSRDRERTAEVTIRGSRAEDRKPTTVCPLGTKVWQASLMPSEGSVACRGLNITAGAAAETPFTVDSVIGREVKIRFHGKARMLKLVVVDPVAGNTVESEFADQTDGEFAVPVTAQYAIVAIGAWLEEGGEVIPWEGWFTAFRPDDFTVDVTVPERAAPGDEVAITVKTNRPNRSSSVILLVADDRLIRTGDLSVNTTSALLADLLELSRKFSVGRVTNPLFSPDLMWGGRSKGMRSLSLESYSAGGDEVMFLGAPRGGSRSRGDEVMYRTMGVEDVQAVVAPIISAIVARLANLQTVYAGIVLVSGSETVRVTLPDGIAGYRVSAMAVNGGDWTQAGSHVQAVKPVYAELVKPAFVMPGQVGATTVHVVSLSGKATVSAWSDGQPIGLYGADGTIVDATTTVKTPVDLTAFTGPGVLAVQTNGFGQTDHVETLIPAMGKLTTDVRKLKLLLPGNKATATGLGAVSIRIMPGLDEAMTLMTSALVAYAHDCCQQTSAKMFASLFSALMGGGPAAVEHFSVGLARMKSMLVPGGFKMYPESPNQPNDYWGKQAARNLYRMRLFIRDRRLPSEMYDLVSQAAGMGQTVVREYSLAQSPESIASCEDACMVMLGNPSATRYAVEFVLKLVRGESAPALSNRGIVSRRAETAYAAAVLARDGQYLEKAVALANTVIKDLNAQGRLHSPEDSLAALFMMGELSKMGIAASSGMGYVRINGQSMAVPEAVAYAGGITSVEAVGDAVMLQYTVQVTEDWFGYAAKIPVSAMVVADGRIAQTLHSGREENATLVIQFPGGYRDGNLVHVALPQSVCVLEGGAQSFAVTRDPRGSDRIEIPLHVTGPSYAGVGTIGTSDVLVQVTNMFEEEDRGMVAVGVRVE
jgi:hypothetical protein